MVEGGRRVGAGGEDQFGATFPAECRCNRSSTPISARLTRDGQSSGYSARASAHFGGKRDRMPVAPLIVHAESRPPALELVDEHVRAHLELGG